MINLTELTKAVSAVAGVAAERDKLRKVIADTQADIDHLTAALLAAANSPAEAVGIAAVADAVAAFNAQAETNG
jgi:adenylate kinase